MLTLTLAACAVPQNPATTDSGAGTAPPPSASSAASNTSENGPAETERATQTAAAVAAPMPDIEIDASSLKGMTGDELAELFGPPIFSRRDRGSEILRFRGRDCLLDAFLYGNAGEADAAPWRVDHFETRDEDGRPVAVDDCLTDVALAHAASG